MFIIIEYTKPNYDKVHIVSRDKEPILFGSNYTAQIYAERNCILNYKIVEL